MDGGQDDKKGDKLSCVPKATFFPPRRRQWAGFGWALWRRGAHAHSALTQSSEPRATSSADCHPCQGALCPGGSQGHICAAMCRAAHKTALAWDQQHPLPGGKAASDPNFGKHTGVMGTSCLLHLPWGSWDQLAPSSFKMKVMELPSGFGGS